MALKSIIKPRITEAEEAEAAEELAVSASGARDNAIQRLQVGFFGLGAILNARKNGDAFQGRGNGLADQTEASGKAALSSARLEALSIGPATRRPTFGGCLPCKASDNSRHLFCHPRAKGLCGQLPFLLLDKVFYEYCINHLVFHTSLFSVGL